MLPKRHSVTVTWSIPTDDRIVYKRKKTMRYVENPGNLKSGYRFPVIAMHILANGSSEDDEEEDEDILIVRQPKRPRPTMVEPPLDIPESEEEEDFPVPQPLKRLRGPGEGALTTVSLGSRRDGTPESVVTSVDGQPVVGHAVVLPNQAPSGYETAYQQRVDHIMEGTIDGGVAPSLSQGQTFEAGVAELREREANDMEFYYPLGGSKRTLKLQKDSVFDSLFPFGQVFPAIPVEGKKKPDEPGQQEEQKPPSNKSSSLFMLSA